MYERFTERARAVLDLANQEARRHGHKRTTTEHVLLGLVIEGSGTGVRVLKELNVDPARVREKV